MVVTRPLTVGRWPFAAAPLAVAVQESVVANTLLESTLPVGAWMAKLSSVSAKLYEAHVDLWERFEPQRKRLEETLSFLDYEGHLDLQKTTVSRAIEILSARNPDRGNEWRDVASAVERALSKELSQIFASSAGRRGN